MYDTIVTTLKLFSWILVISIINGIRYYFLKRKLKSIYYEKYKDEILTAIRGRKINGMAFFKEPLETGNDALDLLLFKIHRSVLWFIGFLLFYLIAVIFIYLSLRVIAGK